jgi:hypothetical protein
MVRRLSALRPRTRIALSLVLVSVPAAVVAGYLVHRVTAEERFCTLMAGVSGLSVRLELPGLTQAHDRAIHRQVALHHPPASIRRAVNADLGARFGIRRVVVCATGRCASHPVGDVGGFGVWPPIRATGPDRIRVSVAVDRPGAPWQVAHTTVRLQRDEPNGPGCGTWWNAAVRMRDGQLVTTRG